MSTMITMPFQSWSNMVIIGLCIVISSEIVYHLCDWYFPKKTQPKKPPVKKFKMPGWAIAKMEAGELDPPKITEEQLAALNMRRPPEMWNTALIFPDVLAIQNQRANSTLQQYIRYFDEAKTSIYLCMYVNSNHDLTEMIRRKYLEGLLVQIVTDYDTWTAHNNSGTKKLKRLGIDVRMKNTGYLMHNKFAIIDEEAVLTGSLNWTRQAVQANQENVLVTTDQRIVSKYLQEFYKLWGLCEPVD